MALELIKSLIENLAPYIQEEYATFKGVHKHAAKLLSNLTAIRAVLIDAEEKQIHNHALKHWLQNLTDAAHVLDDILDKCSIVSEAANKDTIPIFHPKKLYARRGIGKKMNKIAQRIEAIAEERDKFGLLEGTTDHHHHLEDDDWRQTTSVITEPQILGRDEDKEKVVDFLTNHATDKEEISVYSIVGHGGYGKTALAKLIFNDERVNTHFDFKVWVCVSDQFSIMKVLQLIIEFIDGRNSSLSSLESTQRKVLEILQDKRYLIVLDDVWSEDQHKWNDFKHLLHSGTRKRGASILVTTRLETVASAAGSSRDDATIHRLVDLPDDDIWSLFKQHAFGANGEQRAELVTIGKEIVKKCVGSPLAAKVLGSLLRFETEECQWLSIKESEIWNLTDDKIISALSLSYYHLRLSLRPCFTFCAVYPKGFEMEKDDLIHLWMANGFISSRGNLEVEQVGNQVWNELYHRSFFQEAQTSAHGKVTFKMHDIFHDIASSIMGEHCLASGAAGLTNFSKRLHHISCFNNGEQIKYNTVPFKKVESLRSFLDFGKAYIKLSVFPSNTPLRALSTGSPQPQISFPPPQISSLKSFIHLRYLRILRSSILTLPRSICELRKLQTLKLEVCPYLNSVPKQLTQIQDLRHLVIRRCPYLSSIPPRIGRLTHLRTLSFFNVGSKAGFSLAELKNLQLGGQLHIKGLENVSSAIDARDANLVDKKDLSRLYLSWGGDSNSQRTSAEQVLEAFEAPTGLKYFGMNGYKGISMPNWMRHTTFLEGLVVVILYNCTNCERLPPFGKLPCLTTLYLSKMRHVKYIDDDVYEGAIKKAFPSLKEMTLIDLPNLERMLEAEGVEILVQLSALHIEGVPKLAFPFLPSVETVHACWKSYSDSDSNDDGSSFLRGIGASMYNLKILSIVGFNKLKVLPNELNTLSSLQELYISTCPMLESIPECVMQGLSSLQILTLRYCNSLESLPEAVRNLTCLKSLEIVGGEKSGTSIMPNGLEGIPSLQRLYLGDFFSLVSLPDWLGTMTSLQRLTISCCPELTSLPPRFQELNLHKLCIFGCPILEMRCKEETGEEWHKIAHIPNLELNKPGVESSFYEKMVSLWTKSKQFLCYHLSENLRRHLRDYFSDDFIYNFDRLVDII